MTATGTCASVQRPLLEEGPCRPQKAGRWGEDAIRFADVMEEHMSLEKLPPAPELWTAALKETMRNWYFWANFVYVGYSVGMLVVDYWGLSRPVVEKMYLIFGLVHVANSWMYVQSWRQLDWKYFDPPVLPEYLNVVGSLLYLASAILYPYEAEDDFNDDVVWMVHRLEMTASSVEVLAALGWVWSWWYTFVRKLPGRGWTLDDPDVWACMTIVPAALVYLLYNIKIITKPETYFDEDLYKAGDLLYFINSVLYLCCSLRDDGWFWFMPLAGVPRGQSRVMDKMIQASLQVTVDVASGRASFITGRQSVSVDLWFDLTGEDDGAEETVSVCRHRRVLSKRTGINVGPPSPTIPSSDPTVETGSTKQHGHLEAV